MCLVLDLENKLRSNQYVDDLVVYFQTNLLKNSRSSINYEIYFEVLSYYIGVLYFSFLSHFMNLFELTSPKVNITEDVIEL